MDWKHLFEKILAFYRKHKLPVLIGAGVLLVVIVLGAARFALNGRATAEQTQIVTVTRGAITESIDTVGTLEARPYIELAWESGGIVSPFRVQVGERVEKGAVLMELEDSSLSASILQSQTDILEAQAALDNLLSANSNLYAADQALADAEYTLLGAKKNRDAWNRKGGSDETIEEHRSGYYAAKQTVWEKEIAFTALSEMDGDDPKRMAAYEELRGARLARDEALRQLNNVLGSYYSYAAETDFIKYDIALAAVEEARVAYLRYLDPGKEIEAARANVQALQNSIDMSRIIAPFNGTVTEVSSTVGEKVASGDMAVRLDNLENLMVAVYVSEVDINKVKEGMPAQVSFDAIPGKTYEGQVQSMAASGSSESGVVEFRVDIQVMNADEQVKPGFTAVVSVVTSQVAEALLVPSQALVTSDGGLAVMRVNADGSTSPVLVEIGASSEVFTEILDGDIQEGDRLAMTITENQSLMPGGIMFGGQMRQMTGDGQRPRQ